MFDTLTEHETVALSDFFEMVEEVTGKTVGKLLRHPLLSSLHRQISHIVYVNNRIQRLDSKNFKTALNIEGLNELFTLMNVFEEKHKEFLKKMKMSVGQYKTAEENVGHLIRFFRNKVNYCV